MFGRLGWLEILIIVVLVVILFGSSKIPGMMRNLADGVNTFRREMGKKGTRNPPTPRLRRTSQEPGTSKKSATDVEFTPAKSAKKPAKKPVAKKSPAKKVAKKK
ncbi:MAG: twin-arginine translocase TatA/TatE family subunit [Rickettsiales bacterium]|nr:twin-arginine translocase TatA/TatE family subunit [Rickettsiales bacterium]